METLEDERRKLLALHYEDRISADLFAQEEARLTGRINALRDEERASRADCRM